MRKFHQLLPIAREYLITAEHPEPIWQVYEEYTCFAANIAYKYGRRMTEEEAVALSDAIGAEIAHQCDLLGMKRVLALIALLYLNREISNCDACDPSYFPARDAWLDALQSKWERGNI